MTKAKLLILLLFSTAIIYSQELDDFIRRSTDSPMDYVQRVKEPEDVLTYKVIETDEWDSKNPSIIAFYQIPREKDNRSEIIGHVYMKQYDVEYYRDIVFGEFLGESEYPEIVDVFWKNIDKDKEKELFVLFKYLSWHYDFTGYIYDLSVLDNPNYLSGSLEKIKIIGESFIGFEGMNGEGKEYFPTYATKDEVLNRIIELGY